MCIWFNKIDIIYINICKDLFLSTIIVSRFKFSSKEKDKNIISWKQDPTMSNNNFEIILELNWWTLNLKIDQN